MRMGEFIYYLWDEKHTLFNTELVSVLGDAPGYFFRKFLSCEEKIDIIIWIIQNFRVRVYVYNSLLSLPLMC